LRCVDPLRGYGFVAEGVETVMIGEAALMARDPVLPAGVALRAVGDEVVSAAWLVYDWAQS
jgi:hypothetical protein